MRLAVGDRGMVDTRVAAAPVTLTVLNFQNRQTGDGYEWLQRAFPDMLLTHFVQHGKFTVVERERMQVLLDELKLAQTGVTRQDEAAKFAGIAKVQKVVYGHYAVERDRLSVTAFIFDATSNTVDAVATADGGLDSLCDIEHQLFSNLLGRLGTPLTETDQGKLRCVVSSSLSAAAHFYDGMGAFDAGDYPEALVQFQQAGRQDPRYGEARLWAARMYSYLGEPAHAVVELRQFTSDLPEHPLVSQGRLQSGLMLLQDFRQPRLAAAEFEKLVALAPETGVTPAELRQAHLDEYLTLYRGLWRYWNPTTHTVSEQNILAAVKLELPGKERAQKLDVYVEGWLRLGQAYEAAGDLLGAFRAYDQGRADCRWLLLDQSKLTDQLYDSTRAMYQRLLLTDGITVPIPDWALPMAGDQPHQIFGDNLKELCQYQEGKGPERGTERMVVLPPTGQEFDTITLSVPGGHCGVIDLARPRFVFRGVKMSNTNGLGKTIVQIGKPFDYRAAEIVVNREPDDSVSISATYRPWKAIHHPKFPVKITSDVLVHPDPTNAVVLIDDQLLKTNWMGEYTLSPRPHRIAAISDGRTNTVMLQCQTNAQHQVYLELDSPWRDTGVRLPPGRYPDICRAPDGQYWLVFVPSKLGYDKEKGMFIHDDSVDEIWLTKSHDLREWTPPVRLSINSPEGNRMPRLTLLPDGRMQLVFLSDRRRSGTPGLYLSESIDSRAWSPPRRVLT